ncbi:MAG: DUF2721 domain-containing protein [Solirubrobacterales bacterium]|nr:DUF2721 domain-containing protein [Solirubrobacterales bacterium]
MIPTAAQAIEAMVAPVVLITAGAILSNGMLSVSGSVNDRMRTMNRERLGLLTGGGGTQLTIAELGPAHQERIGQIDIQMPMLMRRHRLLLDAVLAVYLAVGTLVMAVIVLGIAVTIDSEPAGIVALALVLAGTAGLLTALAVAARSTLLSHDAIDFETKATLSIGRAQSGQERPGNTGRP